MHILYVDDSGSVGNADERFFVLGGLSVFERGIYHLIEETDACVRDMNLGDPEDIELHATDMYGGRKFPWKDIRSRPQREELIHTVLDLVSRRHSSFRLFAVAIDKAAISPADPVETAFEQICNRFNKFIERNNDRNGHKQRGLIIMDESRDALPLQALARSFRINGGRWGHFRCLAEVPLFINSKSSRLAQLADMIAWSTYRYYEHKDGRFFEKLIPHFDADGGVIHGLYHAKGSRTEQCYCPACVSRDLRDARAP